MHHPSIASFLARHEAGALVYLGHISSFNNIQILRHRHKNVQGVQVFRNDMVYHKNYKIWNTKHKCCNCPKT